MSMMAQRLARRAEDRDSGGPRFQSHPRLTFQSCSRYQLNQLGSKAASESTVKKSNTCGVSNNRLYFTLEYDAIIILICCFLDTMVISSVVDLLSWA